jgi:2-amino-4-hydroxy-6-hydroxymethyldihydropteridine diphosphokinase
VTEAFLLLGSNIGERSKILSSALELIEKYTGGIERKSSLYETEPWGKQDQNLFLNQLVSVITDLTAQDLLKTVLEIEAELGRRREEKWGPRIIDIDIIYFGEEIIVTPDLKIPHPEIQNRNFTLIPLCEIAKDFIHPVWNISSEEMLKRCKDSLLVSRFED